MTTFTQSALELFIQVTLWCSVGIVLLAVVSRYRPLRLAHVSLCFLAGVVVLTTLVWVPWPAWIATSHMESSTPVGSHVSLPLEEMERSGSGFNFSVALKSWQQLMPTLSGASPAIRQPDQARGWAWWIMLLVGLGMVLGIVRLLLAFRHVKAHVTASKEIDAPALVRIRDQLSEQLGLLIRVRLLESPTLQVPATVGCWKPTILLPLNWATWSDEECRTVLAHELAHVRRTDYLMMVMTQIITIVYWFHPLVRGLSRWMRCGQELAADALAVRVVGDQSTYLRSLCRLALSQDGLRLPAPARLFLSPEVSLFRRIAMLRDGTQKTSGSRLWVRGLMVMVVLAAGMVVATLRSAAVADEKKSSAPLSTSSDWQRYVDANAPGYVIFRPAATMSLASMEPHRAALNKLFKEEIDVLYAVFGMGVPLDAVECFAGPVDIQLRKNGEKGTGAMTVRGAYFQLRTKEDTEAWIKHCMLSVEKKEHQSGTYYKANGKPKDMIDGTYFLRPDERTIVFAESEKQLLGWLADVKKPVTMPAWLTGMPNDTGIITTAINMKNDLIKKGMQQAGDGAMTNPMFKPMYEHEGSVICTLQKEDSLSLQLTLGCADAESAGKKKKQLDGMLATFKLMLGTGPANGLDEKQMVELQVAMDLINNLKSSQEGNLVQFTTHGSLKIGDAIKSQMVEMTGKLEKVEKK